MIERECLGKGAALFIYPREITDICRWKRLYGVRGSWQGKVVLVELDCSPFPTHLVYDLCV